MPSATKAIIFDFDGTLFDTHDSIAHTLALTFSHLLPPSITPPSRAAIAASISAGLSLPQTITQLYPSSSHIPALDAALLDKFLATYRSLYKTYGTPLIKPFAHVHELLSDLRARSIPCAILSNKGIAAVRDVLAAHHLSSLIELVVGDGEPAACPRKPDPGSWTMAIKPAFEQRAEVVGLQAEDVLVVGDTEADIRYAWNIGARSVWCSYGYGELGK
jgi:phosphoglycolate phosphatase